MFPSYVPKKSIHSTKDRVLWILVTGQKSIKQVHAELRSVYDQRVSYQAVFQTLQELHDAGVIEKSDRLYSLNKPWVRDLVLFTDILKKQVLENQQITYIDETSREVIVQSYVAMGEFLFEFLAGKNVRKAHLNHLWFPYIRKERRSALRDMLSSSTITVASNSFVDRLLSVFYRSFAKVRLGVKQHALFESIGTDDCVVQIHLPATLRTKLNNLYKAKNLFSMQIMDDFSEIVHESYTIKILIITDSAIAKEFAKD